jgi:hypothetical protein
MMDSQMLKTELSRAATRTACGKLRCISFWLSSTNSYFAAFCFQHSRLSVTSLLAEGPCNQSTADLVKYRLSCTGGAFQFSVAKYFENLDPKPCRSYCRSRLQEYQKYRIPLDLSGDHKRRFPYGLKFKFWKKLLVVEVLGSKMRIFEINSTSGLGIVFNQEHIRRVLNTTKNKLLRQ